MKVASDAEIAAERTTRQGGGACSEFSLEFRKPAHTLHGGGSMGPLNHNVAPVLTARKY